MQPASQLLQHGGPQLTLCFVAVLHCMCAHPSQDGGSDADSSGEKDADAQSSILQSTVSGGQDEVGGWVGAWVHVCVL